MTIGHSLTLSLVVVIIVTVLKEVIVIIIIIVLSKLSFNVHNSALDVLFFGLFSYFCLYYILRFLF